MTEVKIKDEGTDERRWTVYVRDGGGWNMAVRFNRRRSAERAERCLRDLFAEEGRLDR